MDRWPRWYLIGALRGVASLVHQGADDDVLERAWAANVGGAPLARAVPADVGTLLVEGLAEWPSLS
jgi:hypothetical protein